MCHPNANPHDLMGCRERSLSHPERADNVVPGLIYTGTLPILTQITI
jgi:hypothetical protein